MGLVKNIWNYLIGAPEAEVPNTMLLIDARSGQAWSVPDGAPSRFDAKNMPRVDYPDGEFFEVLAFEPGVVRARALLRRRYINHMTNQLVDDELWVPLQVRWFHPAFMKQHVAFIPS